MNTCVFPAGSGGIYRAPADVGALPAAARSARLSWTVIDLRRVRGKRPLLNAFARALGFPGTFGGNWDALADCLQDLSWLQDRDAAGGWVMLMRGVPQLAAAAPSEHATMLEIIEAAAAYWQQHRRAFVVLVEGGAEFPPLPAA